ncbi:hypothetical protein VHUM_03284 [Vanrija humicola]|uniref:Uncharacterized protein n=1 Tax=Vanrija humicola TaxID=5417 RepID=A0A7D8UY31_VANHU|nr:hypothetical protein VHUM_03284 [Vanrija humicola]
MYYDLFLPFPTPEGLPAKKKKEAKGKATPAPADCWAGLDSAERAKVSRDVALAGHLGYNVVAYTVSAEQSTAVTPCPFGSADARNLPFPTLDPRFSKSSDAGPSQPTLVQVTRYHMRLDDGKVHPITAANTNALQDYDILSAYVGSDKAFQVACVELSNPGPNQLSIITVPLHERPFSFRLNRKQVRQALRMGVVVSGGNRSRSHIPPLTPSVPPESARRYRQNFLANARELVRVTEGKGIILSSGPDGSSSSLRGPLDAVNLATILGVPANLAKEALSLTPKKVLLRAQARRTHKAVTSTPRLVPPPSAAREAAGDDAMEVDGAETGAKRAAADSGAANKKTKVGA